MPPHSNHRQGPNRYRCCTLVFCALAGLALTACTTTSSTTSGGDAQMAAYLKLVMPARVEIQRYLTRPVSHAGDGVADGLEVILAAYDSTGDLTKVIGTFHFELETRRLQDRIGRRVAFWPVEIKSGETMRMYRDHLSRYYHFPLQLDNRALQSGAYTLRVWLHLPTGERLLDEYEFAYDGHTAPTLRPL